MWSDPLAGGRSNRAWTVEDLAAAASLERFFGDPLSEAEPLPIGCHDVQQVSPLGCEPPEVSREWSGVQSGQQECHRDISGQEAAAPASEFIGEAIGGDETGRDAIGEGSKTEYESGKQPQ